MKEIKGIYQLTGCYMMGSLVVNFYTHVFPMHLFFTPWKNQKTFQFSGFFRGLRKGALGTNGLSLELIQNLCNKKAIEH